MLDKTDGPSLRQGFLDAARLYADRPALVVKGTTRTYAELENTARTWAAAIVHRLDRTPARIGVFAYRSETAYAGVLAALMAGATFVPLNPTFPPERTASMIRAADLDAIIVDSFAVAQIDKVLAGAGSSPLLLLPEMEDGSSISQWTVLTKKDLDVSPLTALPPISVDDVAYLLFTSGSTGQPKGVPVTHGNVMHFLRVMIGRYKVTCEDRFSQTFDQTFDLSVFDQFMAWHSGACLYSVSSVELLAPTAYINSNRLTVWFSVPSVVAQMRRRKTLKPDSVPSLRLSLFCGEPLPCASAEQWQSAASNSIVENLYGPTELTIACFLHRWDGDASRAVSVNDVVPIGRPYDGLAATVVDDALTPVSEDVSGELCVTGPQTSPGYWRDPERTQRSFVQIEVAGESRRFYRTGDRVTRTSSGEYVFLGRVDDQIKVLGHRVELAEIEAVLREDSHVAQAIAIGWPMEDGVAQGIVAFVNGTEPDIDALRARAAGALPAYEVPQRIILMGDMPLNANGKVDRKALRAILAAEGNR